jgi:hypothetical protein
MTTRIGRLNRTFAHLLLAAALFAPAAARAGDKKPEIDKKAAPVALKEAGLSFEAARLLAGADRQAALEELDGTVGSALKGDLSDDEQAAARALSAQIRFELQTTPAPSRDGGAPRRRWATRTTSRTTRSSRRST